MKYLSFAFASLLSVSAPAAEEHAPAGSGDAVAPLTTIPEWLALQRSGQQAGAPNALPGEARELIWLRFLNSFAPVSVVATPYPPPQGR